MEAIVILAITHVSSPNIDITASNSVTAKLPISFSSLFGTDQYYRQPSALWFSEDTELYREQADNALEKYKEENSDFAPFRVDKVMRAVER